MNLCRKKHRNIYSFILKSLYPITNMAFLKKILYPLFLVAFIFGLISNCSKTSSINMEKIQEDITPIMSDSLPIEVSTFFLVRHAEKALTGDNPSLTIEGKARAEELARLLEEIPIDAIYSTDYKRTMETAMPTAQAKNIPIKTYNPSDLEGFAASFQRPTTNKKILIVGHSNTTPALINIFANSSQYANLTEKQYDNLYILSSVDRKVVDVLTIKYGKESE